jgi:hypothetical protein
LRPELRAIKEILKDSAEKRTDTLRLVTYMGVTLREFDKEELIEIASLFGDEIEAVRRMQRATLGVFDAATKAKHTES